MDMITVIDVVARLVAIVADGFSIWVGVDRIKSKRNRKNDDESKPADD